MKVEQDPNLSTDQGAPGATTKPPLTASSHQQRHERGRAAHRVASRDSHAEWAPPPDRLDPVDLLKAQARDWLPDLVPIR